MAYFDSAKNRVLWLDELAGLKQMKDSYERTGVDPFTEKASRTADTAVAGRTPVSFAELEREEEMTFDRQRTIRNRDLELRKERLARRRLEQDDPELADKKRGLVK